MQMHPHTLFNPQNGCLTEQALFDYIDGRLSAPECHQAEKHMLDCAFCSDALEGLEQLKDRRSVHVHPVKEEKAGTDRGLILPFNANVRLAAAAMLVLLLGAYILFGYILNQEKSMQMSQADAKEKIVSPEPLPPAVSDEKLFSDNFKPGSTEAARKEFIYKESFKESAVASDQEADTFSDAAANAPSISTNTPPVISKQEAEQGKVRESKEAEAPPQTAVTQANTPASGMDVAVSAAPARAEVAADEVSTLKRKSSLSRNRKKNADSAPAAIGQNGYAKESEATLPEADVSGNKMAQTNSDKANDRSDKTLTDNPKTSVNSSTDSVVYKKQAVPSDKVTPAVRPVSSVAVACNAKAHTKNTQKKETAKADLLEEGLNAYDHKSYAVALELFRKVLSIDPVNETALLFSGFSYLSIGPADTRAAINCFDKLLQSRNKDLLDEAVWFKALALIKESKKEAAEKLLKDLSRKESPYQERAKELLKEMGK
jgi:tetratricopeptide (TPR) repeat protein